MTNRSELLKKHRGTLSYQQGCSIASIETMNRSKKQKQLKDRPLTTILTVIFIKVLIILLVFVVALLLARFLLWGSWLRLGLVLCGYQLGHWNGTTVVFTPLRHLSTPPNTNRGLTRDPQTVRYKRGPDCHCAWILSVSYLMKQYKCSMFSPLLPTNNCTCSKGI